MTGYMRCSYLFALHIELSNKLGMLPFFNLETCNGETIMTFPFGEIIITPRTILLSERLLEQEHISHEKRNKAVSTSVTRIAKN